MLKRLKKVYASCLTLSSLVILVLQMLWGFKILRFCILFGILAAIAPRLIGQPEKARIALAKQEIATLEIALQMYALNVGDYPMTEQGLRTLYQPPIPTPENWERTLATPSFIDPWGSEYVYIYPGTNDDFDLYSLGKDGKPGGKGFEADITNGMVKPH